VNSFAMYHAGDAPSYFGGKVGISKVPVYPLDVFGVINCTGPYGVRNAQAPNDAPLAASYYLAGADATLGALTLEVDLIPSATGANRYVHFFAGDNAAYRPLVFNMNGGGVGIGKKPVYQLDVAGDCNITGAFRVNGVPLAITNQSVVTGTRAAETIYRNTSGKTLFVLTCWNMTGSTSSISFVSDASATPTIVVTSVATASPQAATLQLSGMVLPGNYYQCHITGAGVTLASWVEYS
jgi:hypothetical protein